MKINPMLTISPVDSPRRDRSPSRDPLQNQQALRYAAALCFTAAAVAVLLVVRPKMELNAFNLFQGAVFLSTWFGGLGPGLLASALSIVAMSYFFIPPYFDFRFTWAEGGVDVMVFGVLAFVVSSLSARLKEAKANVERAHDKLEDRIEERTRQLSDANTQLSSEMAQRLEAERAILEISRWEQQRMGQDMHDGLCQTLAGLRLIVETLNDESVRRQANAPEKATLDKMETLLSQALSQADSISRGLYPVELETNGLQAALQDLAQYVSNIYSVDCRLVYRKPIPVKSDAATHVFRIAQEAVTNAIKNGKAKKIRIRFFNFRSRILLVIADSGVGLEPASSRKGMGLKIVEYRARILNAVFTLKNRRGGGTLAVCSMYAL